jgi:hypothetical protein
MAASSDSRASGGARASRFAAGSRRGPAPSPATDASSSPTHGATVWSDRAQGPAALADVADAVIARAAGHVRFFAASSRLATCDCASGV